MGFTLFWLLLKGFWEIYFFIGELASFHSGLTKPEIESVVFEVHYLFLLVLLWWNFFLVGQLYCDMLIYTTSIARLFFIFKIVKVF